MLAQRGGRGRLQPIRNPAKPSPHCTVHWVGLRASLESTENLAPNWDSISGPCSLWQVTILITLPLPPHYNSTNLKIHLWAQIGNNEKKISATIFH